MDPLTGTGNTDMVEFRATICLFIHFLTQIFFNRKILSIFNMKPKSPQRKRGFLTQRNAEDVAEGRRDVRGDEMS